MIGRLWGICWTIERGHPREMFPIYSLPDGDHLDGPCIEAGWCW